MKNIFVGNLDSATTVASIRTLFQTHGTIEHVKLMTDKETGLSRGFAFVEMADEEALRAITALNGSIVDGSTVTVNEGRPKLHRGGSTRDRAVPGA